MLFLRAPGILPGSLNVKTLTPFAGAARTRELSATNILGFRIVDCDRDDDRA